MFASAARTAVAFVVSLLLVSAASAGPVRVDGGLLEGTAEDGLMVYRASRSRPRPSEICAGARPASREVEGVRKADAFGRACLRINQAIANLPTPSEDCLYLNVWSPATRADERLAVIVWIHGGGFTAGTPPSGCPRRSHREEGVVVVSLAYRLGVFGFLARPAERGTTYTPPATTACWT